MLLLLLCYAAVPLLNCLRNRRSIIENKLLSFAARSQDTYHCFSVFLANRCAIITACASTFSFIKDTAVGIGPNLVGIAIAQLLARGVSPAHAKHESFIRINWKYIFVLPASHAHISTFVLGPTRSTHNPCITTPADFVPLAPSDVAAVTTAAPPP